MRGSGAAHRHGKGPPEVDRTAGHGLVVHFVYSVSIVKQEAGGKSSTPPGHLECSEIIFTGSQGTFQVGDLSEECVLSSRIEAIKLGRLIPLVAAPPSSDH